MLIGAPQLQAKLVRLERGFDGIAKQVASESVPDVEKAVRGEVGDNSLSGWRRGAPIAITAVSRVESPGVAEITPRGKSAGPMRVLQSGRNANGGAGGFQGPGVNSRTGRTSARGRTGRGGSKARRSNGHTRGKNTWTDAEQLIRQSLGKRSAKALHQVMAKAFKG